MTTGKSRQTPRVHNTPAATPPQTIVIHHHAARKAQPVKPNRSGSAYFGQPKVAGNTSGESSGSGLNGTALVAIGIGVVFAWSALTGRSPLKVIQAVVKGSGGTTVTPTVSAPSTASAATATSGTAASNQAIGVMLAQPYGWNTGQNWADLVSLWDKESGWSNTADTRKSGAGGDNANSTVFAYGIAQARPATKYPLAGQPPDLGGQADPTTQITWGLQYIQSRYGSPTAAWAHEQANDWY